MNIIYCKTTFEFIIRLKNKIENNYSFYDEHVGFYNTFVLDIHYKYYHCKEDDEIIAIDRQLFEFIPEFKVVPVIYFSMPDVWIKNNLSLVNKLLKMKAFI